MNSTQPARRAYDSRGRRERARATRRRILDAARAEFAEHGYAGATVAQIAHRAEVSSDLVYKSFGTKIGLLKNLLDVTVGGDDEDVAMLERAGPQQLRREPSRRRQVEMLAAGVAEQLERLAPVDAILRSAAAVDAEAAALRHDIQHRQRREAMRTFVRWIIADDGGASSRALVDSVWVITSPENHDMLRRDCRWSRSAYERWLREMLASVLLDTT